MRGPETTTSSNKESPLTVLSRKTTPGLGDDFYNFEQCFGLPIDFDAKHSDFTWAHYRHAQSGVDMVVGSKERSGKVDLVVVSIPRSGTFDEFAIIDASKPLAGKMRTQVVGQAKRSVRYLPTGRLELVSAAASGYKVACLNPQNDDGFILIISRLPQEIDPLLSVLPTKTHLLKRLRFLEHKDVEPHRAN